MPLARFLDWLCGIFAAAYNAERARRSALTNNLGSNMRVAFQLKARMHACLHHRLPITKPEDALSASPDTALPRRWTGLLTSSRGLPRRVHLTARAVKGEIAPCITLPGSDRQANEARCAPLWHAANRGCCPLRCHPRRDRACTGSPPAGLAARYLPGRAGAVAGALPCREPGLLAGSPWTPAAGLRHIGSAAVPGSAVFSACVTRSVFATSSATSALRWRERRRRPPALRIALH